MVAIATVSSFRAARRHRRGPTVDLPRKQTVNSSAALVETARRGPALPGMHGRDRAGHRTAPPAFLVPLAASRRAFRGVRPVIVPIIVVTLLDMAAPTFLTAWGEQHVSSSVAGILTATDPLFTAVLALWLIKSEVPDRRRTAGLIIGFVGVVALLGIDLHGSAIELLGAGAVILSALGYAGAALLYRRWLADQAALAITALMTVISGLAFLPPAAIDLPRHIPPASSILALATLGIVNTGIAYWLFYLLIDEAGAATASVITYVMPVVALFLGVGLLGERLTVGAWLATRQRAASGTDSDPGTEQSPRDKAMQPRRAKTLASIHRSISGNRPGELDSDGTCGVRLSWQE